MPLFGRPKRGERPALHDVRRQEAIRHREENNLRLEQERRRQEDERLREENRRQDDHHRDRLDGRFDGRW